MEAQGEARVENTTRKHQQVLSDSPMPSPDTRSCLLLKRRKKTQARTLWQGAPTTDSRLLQNSGLRRPPLRALGTVAGLKPSRMRESIISMTVVHGRKAKVRERNHRKTPLRGAPLL
jgi:hypothetical protein